MLASAIHPHLYNYQPDNPNLSTCQRQLLQAHQILFHPMYPTSLQRSIPTQINPHTDQSVHCPIPTQSNPYTDQSLHRSIPTQINPYTVQSLHRSIPTQINPYTDQSLHSAMSVSASTGAMTNSSFWSNNRRSSQINFLRKPKHTYRHPSHGA